MARSAIGTRSVTGRAAAAAELAKSSRKATRVNSKLARAGGGMGARELGNTIAEGSESELSSVPSDLSDEEDAVHSKTTTSRHFTASTVTGILPTTLGKRQRPIGRGAGLGASGSVNRELRRKKAKPDQTNNVRGPVSSSSYGVASETAASSPGVLSRIRKRPADSSIGIPSSRRTARQLPKTESQVEAVREEVEDLSIKAQDLEEMVEGKGKKPSRGGGNKKRPKPSPPSPLPPPPHWEEMYSLVRSMRERIPAPVDTMGCERLAQPVGGPITPAISRFQTLVSLLLSSQTKDTVTAVAVRKMQTQLPGGLTIPSILATDPKTLDSFITPVGFHNRKTQYLLQTAQICKDKYNSDIPRSIEELCSLPGVGPKMAHLCMSAAWNETQGIGVDVHVHRITNMWGWTGKKGTETPEQTRVALESWLPRDRWREINHLLVGFGQSVCLSRAPRCGECTLAERGLCRAARVGAKMEVKMEAKEEEDVGVKIEGERGGAKAVKRERVKREGIPPTAVDVKQEAEGIVQPRPRRVKREVKREDQETQRTRGSIKREFKQEETEEVKVEIKFEAIGDDRSHERVKRESKLEQEDLKEDILDMEDILGPSFVNYNGRRRVRA